MEWSRIPIQLSRWTALFRRRIARQSLQSLLRSSQERGEYTARGLHPVIAIAIAGLLIAPSAARGQAAANPAPSASASRQAPAPAADVPVLRVNSKLVLVDVTATDAKGKPVHGLTQSDFTVKQDGKLQSIGYFQEYSSERPSAQPVRQNLPPGVFTNMQPPAPTTGAANILMFDDVTTGLAGKGLQAHPEYLMYARQQAIKYVKTMPASTRIAILELADRLRLVQSFTSDRDVLLAAIDSLSYKRVTGASLDPPLPPPFPRPSQLEVCRVLNTQSELAVDALQGAATFLSGIEGRKNLIWFTPGIPWLTDAPEFSRVPCLGDYTRELQRDYGLLTAAQVSLYPVDPRGLCGPLDCPIASLVQDQHSMNEMAEATGGAAYYNRNDLDAAVGEAIATGADYYLLWYVPPHSKYDGQYHRIEVNVDRRRIHLQYRTGYTAIDLAKIPNPPEEKSSAAAPIPDSALHAAMSHGAAPSTGVLFNVRVTRATDPAELKDTRAIGQLSSALKDKHLVRCDFQYDFPPGQITLENEENGKREGSVHFVIVAYDGEGNVLNFLAKSLTFSVKEDQVAHFLQTPFQLPFHLALDLPPGQSFVRMGVLDLPSQRVGTLEIPVTADKLPGNDSLRIAVDNLNAGQAGSPQVPPPASDKAVADLNTGRAGLPQVPPPALNKSDTRNERIGSPAVTHGQCSGCTAAKLVTVDQVDRLLAATPRERDAKMAGQLSSLELSERASSATLQRWEAEFPGSRTRDALIALADASAFLAPPKAEILATAPPSLAVQGAMMSHTLDYVIETIPKLPDFLATRQVIHFDDESPGEITGQVWPQGSYRTLRVRGKSSAVVTYRNGQEVNARTGQGRKQEASAAGFSTIGEFGPILGVVVGDALRGGLKWGYWQRGANGPEAVFEYSVPLERSHYEVVVSNHGRPVQLTPAYHGEMTINPANGVILRLSVLANMQPPYQGIESGIMVEYAPAVIGGKTYMSPARGVAIFKAPIRRDFSNFRPAQLPPMTQLNDISFTNYRMFRSEVQILTGDNNGKP
jgi:VWFA-related protein